MKLRVFIIIGLAGILGSCMSSKTLIVNDASVEKLEQGKEYDDYAVNYALPRSVIKVKVIAEKTVTKPGPFATYAERLLGVANVPTRESSKWSIRRVSLSSFGQRDPNQVYRISSKGASRADRIQLNHEGVLLGINLPPFKTATYDMSRISLNAAGDMVIPGYPDLTIRKHTEPMPDTVYQTFRTDTSFIRLPILKELVSTKSLLNQAEEAANVIMELRQRRYHLLNGEIAFKWDLIPLPEGSALEIMIRELAQMEYDYVSLFVGRTSTETEEFEFTYVPGNNSGEESTDLFTFSNFSGVLAAGNSNGDPVKLVLNPVSGFPGQQDDVVIGSNDEGAKETGLAYRIPGRAEISIEQAGEKLVSESFLIAQYGIIQFLPKQLLSQPDMMIRMHPDLGSLEGIYEK